MTNPNYIIKQRIVIDRSTFIGYKLIETNIDLLLLIISSTDILTYVVSEGEGSEISMRLTQNKNEKEEKKGNIIIDKILKAF